MKDKILETLNQLPGVSESQYNVHYINGFLKQHTDPDYFRIFPDQLSTRLYILVLKSQVEELIEWGKIELAAAGINPVGSTKYYSVGIKHGESVQIVKLKTVLVGSKGTKQLIGLTPSKMRAIDSGVGFTANAYDSGGSEYGGGGGDDDSVSPPVVVSSAF